MIFKIAISIGMILISLPIVGAMGVFLVKFARDALNKQADRGDRIGSVFLFTFFLGLSIMLATLITCLVMGVGA